MDSWYYLERRFNDFSHTLAFKTGEKIVVKENNSSLTKRLIQGFLLVGGILMCLYLWNNRPVTPKLLIPTELKGLLLPEPKPLTPFKLLGQDGDIYDIGRLKGKWTFVFYGYTHCPDVCPTSLSFLAEVFEQLKEQPGGLERTQATFISVDPKRDTPEILKEYAPYFHEKFTGATGTVKEIDAITKQMWAHYELSKEVDENGDYAVDHTSAFFLIDPQARLFAIFSEQFQKDPKTVAKAVSLIRKMEN
ncbi:MAG: SCO family protein [Magnetococcales bacterium]|nr:SCO family protein [Magnetococcales bacterium]